MSKRKLKHEEVKLEEILDLSLQKRHFLLQISDDSIPLLDDGPGVLQLR